MKSPTLANINKGEKYDIYIGRYNRDLGLEESIWANLFRFRKESDRHDSMLKHMESLKNNSFLLGKLKDLSGKILGCYCYSSTTGLGKECHGHNIIKLFNEII